MDHISGIVSHWSKRNLSGAKPATYYIPPNLTSKLKQACSLFYSMNQGSEDVLDCPINIKPLDVSDEICVIGTNGLCFLK